MIILFRECQFFSYEFTHYWNINNFSCNLFTLWIVKKTGMLKGTTKDKYCYTKTYKTTFLCGLKSGKQTTQQETCMPTQCKMRANLNEMTKINHSFRGWYLWLIDMGIIKNGGFRSVGNKLVLKFHCANIKTKDLPAREGWVKVSVLRKLERIWKVHLYYHFHITYFYCFIDIPIIICLHLWSECSISVNSQLRL